MKLTFNSITYLSFNLAIEMLFISGEMLAFPCEMQYVKFQSRNRDAFHFRKTVGTPKVGNVVKFQSRNRDAFHFRLIRFLHPPRLMEFQSRNRDAFHFRLRLQQFGGDDCPFQSRNRDAFHFR